MRVSVCVALLCAALAVCGVSAADPCGGNDYGTAGDFDFYVFAQSWPAQFCQQHMDWPGCSNPTAWQQTNLTMHGMWPNYNAAQDGHSWPQCCPSQYGSDLDPVVAKQLLPQWQTLWPNEQDPTGGDLANSLWDHEWGKHGTCSGLPQKDYFTTAMAIELSIPTPDCISSNVGGSVNLSDLQAAYGATSDDCLNGGDCIASFQCTDGALAGVTTCWDTDFKQQICPAAVLGSQGSQCSGSSVTITSF